MPKDNKVYENAPMVDKIKIVQPEEENEGMLSMIVGTVLVALGILLFVVGVVMFVLYYLPPREDKNVARPVLYELPARTNAAKIVLKGESQSDKVMVWVNDELVQNGLKVEDGKFETEYLINNGEGDYRIELASLQGFPIRLRSEKTSPVVVAIDWTAPSKNVTFKYDKEVDRNTFSISGKAEAGSSVVLKKGDKEYVGKVDVEGNYSIKNIPLSEGKNNFSAVVKDEAGNTTRIDRNVSVVYAMGDINGNGAKDLPESSGLFENQGIYNTGNALYAIFGLLALCVFGVNMYIVNRKLKFSK